MTEVSLLALLATPLLAAVGCILFERGSRVFGVGTGLVELLALACLIASQIDAAPFEYRIAGWPAPLGIQLYVDGLSLLMLVMSVAVGLGIVLYAGAYFRGGHGAPGGSGHFHPLFLITWSALNTVFVSGDLFNWYVTLELLTLSAVGLVGLSGDATGTRAALRYLFAALIASMLYLLGIGILYGQYGVLDWRDMAAAAADDVPTTAGVMLITTALAIKTALFPLHFWLPHAHSAAPAPVSALLSGLVLKASFFIQLRIWSLIVPGLDEHGKAALLLASLGAIAVLWGSMQALRQSRAKLILAYSSVAQVGYFFFIYAMGPSGEALFGGLYLLLSHGFAKAGAFLAVGALMKRAGSDLVGDWGGLARREPVLVLALALAGVNLMGLPPSGGFIGKFVLLSASFEQGQIVFAIVLLAGGLAASIYVFKMVGATLLTSESEDGAPDPELSPALRWVPLGLSTVSILLCFTPGYFLRLLQSGLAI